MGKNSRCDRVWVATAIFIGSIIWDETGRLQLTKYETGTLWAAGQAKGRSCPSF